ncbi:low molecular weight phosphatase family protein [Cellulosimicrobium arenosum]|nr:low molecular weight phosphatase family protein [Cellulosimicrobium arenosum]
MLVVCTGNICRSPAAQLLLADVLDSSVSVSSAGTRALVGAAVAEPVARRLTGLGIDTSGFTARALDSSLVERSDVVVTMTAEHRAAVLGVVPGALRRTFLLTELVLLAEHAGADAVSGRDDEARLRALVAAAGRTRATIGPARAHDVADPYGREDARYAEMLAEVREQATRLRCALRR